MTQSFETESGYIVEFPQGLVPEGEPLSRPDEAYRFHPIPYVIRGRPGLLNVRFQLQKVGNSAMDVYNQDFGTVLQPAGVFTNFRERKHPEMRGELFVPDRYFPVEVVAIRVENLSERLV
ncbi:MAG: hypothetical protein R3F30_10785 [Planctomycetota bacterium]